MDNQQSFGTWLKTRMTELGLTQQQVADAIGVRQQTVSKYLTGDEIPRTERVEHLATVLHVSVFDVLDAVTASIGFSPPEPGDVEARLARLQRAEEEVGRLRRELEGLG